MEFKFHNTEYLPRTYRPTPVEFEDFARYLNLIQQQDKRDGVGCVKIVCPNEWKARKEGYKNLTHKIKKGLIEEFEKVSNGCYETIYKPQRKTITAKKYKQLAESQDYKPPKTKHEQKYWAG